MKGEHTMSYGITDSQNYTDIANKIRSKLGVETQYAPSEMADAIEQISGGGYNFTRRYNF